MTYCEDLSTTYSTYQFFLELGDPLGLGLDSTLDMETLKFSKVEGDELWVELALEGVCSLGNCLVKLMGIAFIAETVIRLSTRQSGLGHSY